jgi:hypothetical protein
MSGPDAVLPRRRESGDVATSPSPTADSGRSILASEARRRTRLAYQSGWLGARSGSS